ncbi:MAG: DUF4416 family protein [Candidatus Omnitrophica bacterium]|nr:DUF4416 family protein [Candidatus Omnitrophota bacterium]
MAEAIRPSPVKLIMGVIFSSEGILLKARIKLAKKFGPLDFESPIMPFDYTKYYEQEMGPRLLRCFFSFKRLINPGDLAAIKLYTNRLECSLSGGKKESPRKINLDPGYISAAKLVLATCKDYSHRIYLDKGVYAEVTLRFQDGDFRALDWAYPDYKSRGYLESFHAIRKLYLKQLSL